MLVPIRLPWVWHGLSKDPIKNQNKKNPYKTLMLKEILDLKYLAEVSSDFATSESDIYMLVFLKLIEQIYYNKKAHRL